MISLQSNRNIPKTGMSGASGRRGYNIIKLNVWKMFQIRNSAEIFQY